MLLVKYAMHLKIAKFQKELRTGMSHKWTAIAQSILTRSKNDDALRHCLKVRIPCLCLGSIVPPHEGSRVRLIGSIGNSSFTGKRGIIVDPRNHQSVQDALYKNFVPVALNTTSGIFRTSSVLFVQSENLRPAEAINTDCPICFGPLHADAPVFQCGHGCCMHCCVEWNKHCDKLGEAATCPLCRTSSAIP